jgi:hypothetical protein
VGRDLQQHIGQGKGQDCARELVDVRWELKMQGMVLFLFMFSLSPFLPLVLFLVCLSACCLFPSGVGFLSGPIYMRGGLKPQIQIQKCVALDIEVRGNTQLNQGSSASPVPLQVFLVA